MKSTQKTITDFNVGSVARTLIEAPASEIDELYQKMFIGLKEAIPVAIYQAFEFDRIAAIPASGIVRVTITPQASSTLIAAGTAFKIDGVATTFTSQYDATIAAGASYVDVSVVASTAGVVGNIPANKSFTIQPTVSALVSATNLLKFDNGRDLESDEERKTRFRAFIAALNHGTVAAIYYGLKLANLKDASGNITEAVQASVVIEPYTINPANPIAYVQCYIHNGSSGASVDLINQAKKIINGYYDASGNAVAGWKAAGVKVDIYAAVNVSVAVTGTVTVLTGYVAADVISAATTAVSAYLQGLNIGSSAIKSEIIAIIMNIDGVYNVSLSAPSADTVASSSQKIMPGTITLTAA